DRPAHPADSELHVRARLTRRCGSGHRPDRGNPRPLMKPLLRTSLIVFAGALGLPRAATPAPAPAAAAPTPSATIQQRIDALLKRRLRPEPLPVNLPNPFQMSGGIVREGAAEELAARAGEQDGAALANAINQGKINANPIEVLTSVSARLKI